MFKLIYGTKLDILKELESEASVHSIILLILLCSFWSATCLNHVFSCMKAKMNP